MPISVRAQNFQSIEDATVVIDGFTVITGPNNSGKTAFMRAIKGVFTNAAPGPLVRHGTDHLTVTIDFGDGNVVKWEKGWEKPGQKGGTVNRYTINGKVYDKVGATPPDELFELRFGPTEVGNVKLWPQVADQFEGVLFLIGSTGSTVAEAIADVERVGKLNKALRSCESDKRSARSKLKVRREDYDVVEQEVDGFKGLDEAATLVSNVEAAAAKVTAAEKELVTARRLAARLATLRTESEKYAGVEEVGIPDSDQVKAATKLRDRLAAAKSISTRLLQARSTSGKLEGVSKVELPDPSLVEAAEALKGQVSQASRLRSDVHRIQSRIDGIELPDLDFPSDAKVEKARKTYRSILKVRGFRDSISEKRAAADKLAKAIEKAAEQLREAESEVHAVLGEHGECPVCGTVMGGAK